MKLDLGHFILSHLVWIVLVAASLVGFHVWRSEHDARVDAQSQIAAAQAQVVSLQDQIRTRDVAAAQQTAPIVKIIRETTTPVEAVHELQQIVPLSKPIVPVSNGDVTVPQPDILPLFAKVSDDAVCRVDLTAAQADIADLTAIGAQKDAQIKLLKKKPGFFHRLFGTMRTVAIGVGIGVAIGTRI